MDPGLVNYLTQIPVFLSNVVIPFILGIAFVVFVINTIRYFVLEGESEDGQTKAKAQAIYSVAAFVVIIIFWGIVTLLTESFGFSSGRPPCPDYISGNQRSAGNCATYSGQNQAPSGPTRPNQTNF